MTDNDQELIFLTDPMCSWCWGFSPVINRIQESYGERLSIRVVVGGLRPGTTEPMNEAIRDYIMQHWREVEKQTQQPFLYEFNMPEDFKYDTEPGCRAVVTMRWMAPEKTMEFIKALHCAFYLENRDITNLEVLTDIAETFDVDRNDFVQIFESDEAKNATLDDFRYAVELGIRGFPAIVLRRDEEYRLLTIGYQPFEILEGRLDSWFAEVV